jgi:hypothetical protein
MKIKDLIKHLETLDQEKELVIIATDPTGWDYGLVVNDESIELDEVFPSEDNGLEDYLPEIDWSEDDVKGIECYVIKLDV